MLDYSPAQRSAVELQQFDPYAGREPTPDESRAAEVVFKARVTLAVNQVLEEIAPLINAAFERPAGILTKADHTLVTETDTRVERRLRAALLEILPQAGFIGEETAPRSREEAVALCGHRYLWAVDPIDGTANFAQGMPWFAVSVGLLKRGEQGMQPDLGFILLPALNQLAYAWGGEVCLRSLKGGVERAVQRIDRPLDEQSLFMMGDSFGRNFAIDSTVIRNARATGSTVINMLYTALGISGGTVTRAHIWDIAGAMALGALGGVVLRNLDTGRELAALGPDDFVFGESQGNWRLKDYQLFSTAAGQSWLRGGVRPRGERAGS